MISVYRAFKIIIGIFAAVFILYFLILYSGSYSTIQGGIQRNVIVRNFVDLASDVYLTGISANYSGFQRTDMNITYEAPGGKAAIIFSGGHKYITIPLFMRPGGELYITRNSLDFGWWKFYFIEALPNMNIVFNPVNADEDSWNLLRSIVWIIPSTTDTNVNIKFGFCNGSTITKLIDQYDFLNTIYTYSSEEFKPCTARATKNTVIVSMTSNCEQFNSTICIRNPHRGMGYAFINNSGTVFLYKDPVDILALIIGAGINETTPLSEQLYTLKNKFFAKELLLASRIMEERSVLIANNIIDNNCKEKFLKLRDSLTILSNIISINDYYKHEDYARELITSLADTKSKHEDLITSGCEAL